MARFLNKVFAGNSLNSGQFGSFSAGTKVLSTDPATLSALPAYEQGWSAATDSFLKIPRGEEMEGVQRVISAGLVQQWKDGITFWQANMPVTQYQTIVQYQTGTELPKLYVNITGTNGASAPDTDQTNWKELSLGGGLEIGDIGIALYVDETKWLRRRLNGQVIAINEHTTAFLNYLKNVQLTYPSLFTTESNWQSETTLSKFHQCGKFVIDETAGTIRLPAVVNTQGLADLSVIGTIKSESLPNVNTNTGTNVKITGMGTAGASSGAGALYVVNHSVVTGATMGSANAVGYDTWYLNLSRSNSTYQDGAPVQQEAIQYPYFIQINTGSETTSDITNEQVLNNPFSFGDSKYSPIELDNISWLRSQGQWTPKGSYPAYYDWILANANGNVALFKKFTDTYDDYCWVINTSDETFRLPVKTLTAGGSRVVGNGMTLGMTNGTQNGGFSSYFNGNIAQAGTWTGAYGTSVGTTQTGDLIGGTKGVTTDPTKSGIETSTKDIYLYFYVGEVLQNANLIDAGRLADGLANVIPNNSDLIAGYSMPSSQYVDLTLGASDSAYTAPANGWFSLIVQGLTYLDMHKSGTSSFGLISNPASGWARQFVPVLKGETIAVYYTGTPASSTFRFYYSEGSK